MIQRKLARLSLEELGDAHVFVLGQLAYPVHMAVKMNMIVYGENGELEYTGDPEYVDKPFKPSSEWQEHFYKSCKIDELVKYGFENKDYFKKEDLGNFS